MKVNITAAKKKLPELIKKVEAGESITICRRGMPVVGLVQARHSSKRVKSEESSSAAEAALILRRLWHG